jgi:hypothetical protein
MGRPESMAINQTDRDYIQLVVREATSQLADEMKGWACEAIKEAHLEFLRVREPTCPLRDRVILRPYKLAIAFLLAGGGGGTAGFGVAQLLRVVGWL